MSSPTRRDASLRHGFVLVALGLVAASGCYDGRSQAAATTSAKRTPRVTLADGTLRGLVAGATGYVYALWSAPEGTVHVAAGVGSSFAPSRPLGLTGVSELAAAEDRTGWLAVLASAGGQMWLVRGTFTGGFLAPLAVGSGGVQPSVATVVTGHVAMGWTSMSLGWVRVLVPGTGLGLLHGLGPTRPHVWLGATGEGLAIGGYWRAPPLATSAPFPWAERHLLDANGGITAIDPRPEVPNWLPESRCMFTADGDALLAVGFWSYDPVALANVPDVIGFAAGVSAPPEQWQQLDRAAALARDEDGRVVVARRGLMQYGSLPLVRLRSADGTWSETTYPATHPIATAIDAPFAAHIGADEAVVAWTAFVEEPQPHWVLAAAPVTFAGQWGDVTVLDEWAPGDGYGAQSGLTAVATGDGGVVFAWTRGGAVHCVAYR